MERQAGRSGSATNVNNLWRSFSRLAGFLRYRAAARSGIDLAMESVGACADALFELELEVAQRADELARGKIASGQRGREIWCRAEREILFERGVASHGRRGRQPKRTAITG
jgi:hypothetical protein